MTLKELAHAAQQALQTRAGCDVKRSHVHELLAAVFGYQSWAAFLSESMLFDAGVGDASAGATPRVSGRGVQLQYAQGAAVEMAGAVLDFVAERQLSSVRWPQVADVLTPAKVSPMTTDRTTKKTGTMMTRRCLSSRPSA